MVLNWMVLSSTYIQYDLNVLMKLTSYFSKHFNCATFYIDLLATLMQ
jgi:hypothetical protein